MVIVLWTVWAMSLPAAMGILVHVVIYFDSNPPLVYGPRGLTYGPKSYRDIWR